MHQRLPTAEEAASLGIPLSAYESQAPVIVWPENRVSIEVFEVMNRRWHVGMAGATHLDMTFLPWAFRIQGVRRRQQVGVVSDLLVLESAALAAMHPSED